MEQLQRDYRCADQEMYTIGRLGWGNTSTNLLAFAAVRPRYTQTFIDDALLAIDEAEQRPDYRNRSERRETNRVILSGNSAVALKNWQQLKGYITDAFPKELHNIKWQAAGFYYYEKAGNDNWQALKNLLNSGNLFISQNVSTLIANNNMPPDFQDKFKDDGELCLKMAKEFYEAENQKIIATNAKIAANNAVYASLMTMFSDGQRIFSDNEAIKRQFVFDNQLSMITSSTAGIRGYIINFETQQPIEGVTIMSEDYRYSAVTDADGYYRITQATADSYVFIASKPGFETVSQKITIKKGTTSTLDLTMKALENLLKVA